MKSFCIFHKLLQGLFFIHYLVHYLNIVHDCLVRPLKNFKIQFPPPAQIMMIT